MIRLIFKLESKNGWEDYDWINVQEQSEPQKRTFHDLLSHKEDMFNDPSTLYAIKGVHKMVQSYIGHDKTPTLDQFADIYGKMAINGFEICDEMGHNRSIIYLS